MKKVIFLFGMLVSLLVINPAFGQSRFNFYLMIAGIPGESFDDRHKNWIEVFSFKEGVSQISTGARGAGGGGTGRAQFSDLTVTKLVDRASGKLKDACSKGAPIKDVILACVLKGGDRRDIYNVRLMNAFVSGVKGNADSNALLEEVTFSFGAIEWTYFLIDPATGKVQGFKNGIDLTTPRSF